MIDDLIERLRRMNPNRNEWDGRAIEMSDGKVNMDFAPWTAADALEAQARRIEELEVELKVRLPIQEYKAHLKARIAELEAENSVLRRKLELYAATYLSARVISGEKE
jgi:hypothetical protein